MRNNRTPAFRLAILLVLLMAITSLLPVQSAKAEGMTTKDEGVFVMAISYMPDSLSPNTGGSDDYTTMIRPLHENLYMPTHDGYEPRLAKTVDVSEDGKTYTIHLDPEATWSDGTPITSEDVLFSIDYSRYQGKGVSGYERINNEAVTITALDDKTVEFVLPVPYAAYFGRLGGMRLYPAKEFDNDPEKVDAMKDTYYNSPDMLTSGAYKVAEINPDSIVLKARDDYYRGKPQVHTIIMRTVGSGSTRNIAFENGEISYMRITSAEDLKKYSENDDYKIFSVPEDRTNYMQINPYGPQAEILAKPEARQAIAHAINLEEIIAIAYGDEALAKPAKSLVNPSLFFNDPEVENHTYDLEEAKRLAEESGLKGKTLVYIFNRDRVNMEQIATVIQQQLQQIGVNLQVEGMDSSSFFPRFCAKWEVMGFDNGLETTWDLGTNGWDSERGRGGGQSFIYINTTNSAWGFSQELAEMSVKANAAPNIEEGREIYKEVQAQAMDACWIYPLTYTNFVMVAQKNVDGLDQTMVPEFTDWLAIEVH
jgi:peptide/nickel transport system substrate-binding protein